MIFPEGIGCKAESQSGRGVELFDPGCRQKYHCRNDHDIRGDQRKCQFRIESLFPDHSGDLTDQAFFQHRKHCIGKAYTHDRSNDTQPHKLKAQSGSDIRDGISHSPECTDIPDIPVDIVVYGEDHHDKADDHDDYCQGCHEG